MKQERLDYLTGKYEAKLNPSNEDEMSRKPMGGRKHGGPGGPGGPGGRGMMGGKPKNTKATIKRLFSYIAKDKCKLLIVLLCIMALVLDAAQPIAQHKTILNFHPLFLLIFKIRETSNVLVRVTIGIGDDIHNSNAAALEVSLAFISFFITFFFSSTLFQIILYPHFLLFI